MKKFYKKAEVFPAPAVVGSDTPVSFIVKLDGKALKTPLGNALFLPSRRLAEAVAEEWQHQGETVRPETMPLTKLVNTMTDKIMGAERAAMEQQVADYVGSDLVCYHATHPEKLVKLHEQKWSPLVAWIRAAYGANLETVAGIQYHTQPPAALDALTEAIRQLSPAAFTVVQAATATTGSVVIALALAAGHISPHEAYEAACVDEIFQLETWGADSLAQKRLDYIRADLESIAQFRDLVSSSA